ncbi:helix-turn-helix domain-containing protein [Senegalia massiliensis]|uniref:helix-turn-helix domain-containing protein n=1 Tax=Senegalia massiliensis TaxID=1720316 RepID=UPI001362FF7A|nr:helix-turn-helix transcriptional regulator [Senegalia massiliensis]
MRIRELRKEFNLTQEELGKKVGQTKSNISKYETGALEPGIDTLNSLARIFDVSIDYLLGNTDQRNISIDEKYKEVYDVEEAMEVILSQPGLMLNGELLSDESKIILANSILNGIRTVKEIESKKNKQNKKSDDNEQRN